MATAELRQNPFRDHGEWFWWDENQTWHGPFTTQLDALRDLLRHCDTRSRWVKFKELMAELVKKNEHSRG